ncbi:discoidin domain-containing protein, partial [Micromonospora sp. MS34]|uniref:discoidin domain-containing protein n=1 Tax=Micromonospora sp. MS34 TaxID=3385971 RepID=UPI0039A39892
MPPVPRRLAPAHPGRPRPARRLLTAVATTLALLAGGAVAAAPSPVDAASALLSQGRPVTASSVENAGTPASAAVDGDPGTRWSSTFADPQWIQVDLGATATVDQVDLVWEAAYARSL